MTIKSCTQLFTLKSKLNGIKACVNYYAASLTSVAVTNLERGDCTKFAMVTMKLQLARTFS